MSKDILEFVREDDYVEYYLFPYINIQTETIEMEDSVLNNVLVQIQSISSEYCKDYIWHKDEFRIVPRKSKNNLLVENEAFEEQLPFHFYGVTHYGDNVQDEWFIVSLLIKLTKEIEGLIVRTVDSDGEFLLIEAAEYLPSWASPNTCERRIYIFAGNIHIIPLKVPDINCDDMESRSDYNDEDNNLKALSVHQALEDIFKTPKLTVAINEVQQSIKNRIIDFPNNIAKHLHRTAAYIPIAIKKLLDTDPQLIAPAVQAFYDRDTIDLKVLRAMKYFPPENRTYSQVLFTKYLYAMIVHSKYHPDKKVGWNLPPINSCDYKAHSLGMKIACGFEILASQANNESSIEGENAWHIYLKKLKERGYFQGHIEKSQSYNKLLEEAKQYYKETCDTMKITPLIGKRILETLGDLGTDTGLDELCSKRTDLPPDDNENWLNVSPEELDEMMKERYGRKCQLFSTNAEASELTGKLDEFLDHRSGVEGVEFSYNVDIKGDTPKKPQRGIFKNKGKKSIENLNKSTQDNKVDFDPENFVCAVQNILDFKIPEEEWNESSDSDMSEYGDHEGNLNDADDCNLKDYMDEMDKELASTTIGRSFRKKEECKKLDFLSDDFDEVEDFKPVDIDINTLKSMMKSYEGELGHSGPASNLLGSIGVRLEPDMNIE